MLLLAFLALVPRIVLGFLVLHWIWKSVDPRDLLIKVFLAGPAGIGLSSLLSFLWIWANLDLHAYVVAETTCIVLISVFLFWKHRTVILEIPGKISSLTLHKQVVFWLCLLGIAFLLCTGEFWINSLQNPHGRWDAWSNWNVVPRFIYRGGEHWQGTFLRTPDHPDYPFLLAMANASTWELLSRETTRGPMTLAYFLTVSLAGLLFSLLCKLRDYMQASLGAIVLMSMPFVAYHGMALYADLPASYYFLASVGLIPVFLSGREKSVPILAGFMTGLAAWTKNEGLTLVIINIIVWVSIGTLLKDKRILRNFLIGISVPLVVIVLFKVFLAPGNDLFTNRQNIIGLILDIDRYELILIKGGQAFWNVGDGPVSVVAILIVATAIIGKTKLPTQGVVQVMIVVLAQLIVYFLAYVISPYELNWHIRTSLSRLYLHLIPLMLVCLFLWLKSPSELYSREGV